MSLRKEEANQAAYTTPYPRMASAILRRMMKKITLSAIYILLAVALSAEPADFEDSHELESMRAFVERFENELQTLGKFERFGRSKGQNRRVLSIRITFRGPPEADINDIFIVGMKALESWTHGIDYPSKGRGGYENVFSMSYGNNDSFSFFDAIGYKSGDNTFVAIFCKIIE